MNEDYILSVIREHYGLSKKQRIHLYDNQMFRIRLGDTMLDLPFPLSLIREIKLEKILRNIKTKKE